MKPKKNNTIDSYFISCPKGMEKTLLNEIKAYKIFDVYEATGGISFKSPAEAALEILLNSRIGSRIFKQVSHFSFKHEKEIYNQASKNDWTQLFGLRQSFKINTIFDGPASNYFKNSLFFSKVLKDCIVDNFRKKTGKRPNVDIKRPNISLLLRVEKGHKQRGLWRGNVFLDLTGEPLSNRGYRKQGHDAPLRENLAAGIIANTNWLECDGVFIDSMCGSGTLLIEAALIKANISPSYLKIREYIEHGAKPWNFLTQRWFVNNKSLQKFFNSKTQYIYNKTLDAINQLSPGKIIGYDLHDISLKAAKANLRRAMLFNAIKVEKADAVNLTPPENSSGIIICNPPYGERLGDEEKLEKLYYEYGENLKNNFKNFTAFIFTGNPKLRKKISLRTSKRIPFFNGTIDCRLLQYDLY